MCTGVVRAAAHRPRARSSVTLAPGVVPREAGSGQLFESSEIHLHV